MVKHACKYAPRYVIAHIVDRDELLTLHARTLAPALVTSTGKRQLVVVVARAQRAQRRAETVAVQTI